MNLTVVDHCIIQHESTQHVLCLSCTHTHTHHDTHTHSPSDTGRELGLGMVGSSSSELTLAEMFEQIRHCRYIRHYHPDGTEVEELP